MSIAWKVLARFMRMILGDGILVMASLAEREHLRGQVQCIYQDARRL